MSISKRNILIGSIAAALSIALIYAYSEYKKLMDFVISFKSVKLKSLSQKFISFDLFLNIKQLSNVSFSIIKQRYDIYINNNFIFTVWNYNTVRIKKGNNDLNLSVYFSPSDIKDKSVRANVLFAILNLDSSTITVDSRLIIDFHGIEINIPYKYTSSLKELVSKK